MDFSHFGSVANRAVAILVFSLSVALSLSLASPAVALTIDFNYLEHGEIANGNIGSVTISAYNLHKDFHYAVGFNSNAFNTADPDLEATPGDMPWSGGNIAEMELGIMLILQENDDGCFTGICSDPDDVGRRPAGRLSFDFAIPVLDFGFDAIDIESLSAEQAMIEFFDGASSEIVTLMDFFDITSPLYDPTLALGNNTANRFSPITAEFLGLSQMDRVDFHLGGSGAVDNLTITPIPEPTTAL